MRALIVDDSRFVRGYVRGLLEARGFECEEAADGQAALNLLHGAKEFEHEATLRRVVMKEQIGPFGLIRWSWLVIL